MSDVENDDFVGDDFEAEQEFDQDIVELDVTDNLEELEGPQENASNASSDQEIGDDDCDIENDIQPLPETTSNLISGNANLTRQMLTKYEKAKILGERAEQIAYGAPVMIDTQEHDALKIAELELAANKLSVIIRRPLGKSVFEDCLSRDLLSAYM